jgi:hypothetical protein
MHLLPTDSGDIEITDSGWGDFFARRQTGEVAPVPEIWSERDSTQDTRVSRQVKAMGLQVDQMGLRDKEGMGTQATRQVTIYKEGGDTLAQWINWKLIQLEAGATMHVKFIIAMLERMTSGLVKMTEMNLFSQSVDVNRPALVELAPQMVAGTIIGDSTGVIRYPTQDRLRLADILRYIKASNTSDQLDKFAYTLGEQLNICTTDMGGPLEKLAKVSFSTTTTAPTYEKVLKFFEPVNNIKDYWMAKSLEVCRFWGHADLRPEPERCSELLGVKRA